MRGIKTLLLSAALTALISPAAQAYGAGFADGEYAPSIGLGKYHCAVVRQDKSLWTWGENHFGQLGDGTIIDRAKPVKVLDDVECVVLGAYHSAAVKTDRTLWTWGENDEGQLGNSASESLSSPVKILDDVKSVSLGHHHSAAIKTDGSLWLWGENFYGQLGCGTSGKGSDRSTPVKIMDNVAEVSLGGLHSAAVKTDGSLWTWGFNSCGQLGNGETRGISVRPVKVMDDAADADLGWDFSAAVKTDGSLWMWGNNSSGQLGTDAGKISAVRVKITDGVIDVSLGDRHSAALLNDGSLWMWGGSGKPVMVMNEAVIFCTGAFSGAAVTADGDLWMWNSQSGKNVPFAAQEKDCSGVLTASEK